MPDLDECSVCLETPTNPVKTKCNHIFCSECIKNLSKCPNCRADIEDDDISNICYVCSDTITFPIITRCNHAFCYNCIKWKTICPVCGDIFSILQTKNKSLSNLSLILRDVMHDETAGTVFNRLNTCVILSVFYVFL
jgi:hypothetical protein